MVQRKKYRVVSSEYLPRYGPLHDVLSEETVEVEHSIRAVDHDTARTEQTMIDGVDRRHEARYQRANTQTHRRTDHATCVLNRR